MRITKEINGHFINVCVCDYCGEILEERPMIVDGNDMCAFCFGELWSRVKAEKEEAEKVAKSV